MTDLELHLLRRIRDEGRLSWADLSADERAFIREFISRHLVVCSPWSGGTFSIYLRPSGLAALLTEEDRLDQLRRESAHRKEEQEAKDISDRRKSLLSSIGTWLRFLFPFFFG